MFNFKKISIILSILFLTFMTKLVFAQDSVGIGELDDLLRSGQSMVRVAAKWGGILTVVGAAITLGRGRLEGALAQTVCKILIVIGLLVASFSYFGNKVSWGFSILFN